MNERRDKPSCGAATQAAITGSRRSAARPNAGAVAAPSGGNPAQPHTAVAATSMTMSMSVATDRNVLRRISGHTTQQVAAPIEKPNVPSSTKLMPGATANPGLEMPAAIRPPARLRNASVNASQDRHSSGLREAAHALAAAPTREPRTIPNPSDDTDAIATTTKTATPGASSAWPDLDLGSTRSSEKWGKDRGVADGVSRREGRGARSGTSRGSRVCWRRMRRWLLRAARLYATADVVTSKDAARMGENERICAPVRHKLTCAEMFDYDGRRS